MRANSEETQDSIDLRSYWDILKRRWIPATGVAASVFGLVVLSTILQKPTFFLDRSNGSKS